MNEWQEYRIDPWGLGQVATVSTAVTPQSIIQAATSPFILITAALTLIPLLFFPGAAKAFALAGPAYVLSQVGQIH